MKKLAKYKTAEPNYKRLNDKVDPEIKEAIFTMNQKGLVTYNCCAGVGKMEFDYVTEHSLDHLPHLVFRVDNHKLFHKLQRKLAKFDMFDVKEWSRSGESVLEIIIDAPKSYLPHYPLFNSKTGRITSLNERSKKYKKNYFAKKIKWLKTFNKIVAKLK